MPSTQKLQVQSQPITQVLLTLLVLPPAHERSWVLGFVI